LTLALAQKGYVLETGRIVLGGNSSELLENKMVKKAYLGMQQPFSQWCVKENPADVLWGNYPTDYRRQKW